MVAGAFVLFSVPQAFAAGRADVLERIAPIGHVAIGEAAPAAAAPAAKAGPAPEPAAAPAPGPKSVSGSKPAPAAASGGADGAALFAAKGCGGCHGPDAKKTLMSVYPKLAGQSADYLLAQMHDIKSGARNNGQAAVMKGIIAGVSDAEMQAIAGWLSGLSRK